MFFQPNFLNVARPLDPKTAGARVGFRGKRAQTAKAAFSTKLASSSPRARTKDAYRGSAAVGTLLRTRKPGRDCICAPLRASLTGECRRAGRLRLADAVAKATRWWILRIGIAGFRIHGARIEISAKIHSISGS
jgi:hypothetical protein